MADSKNDNNQPEKEAWETPELTLIEIESSPGGTSNDGVPGFGLPPAS